MFLGEFVDQAALHGVIERVNSLGLELVGRASHRGRRLMSRVAGLRCRFAPPRTPPRVRCRRFPFAAPPARQVSGSIKELLMLAYDFPLLGVFWSLLMFALFISWVVTVIGASSTTSGARPPWPRQGAVVPVHRVRPDHRGGRLHHHPTGRPLCDRHRRLAPRVPRLLHLSCRRFPFPSTTFRSASHNQGENHGKGRRCLHLCRYVSRRDVLAVMTTRS